MSWRTWRRTPVFWVLLVVVPTVFIWLADAVTPSGSTTVRLRENGTDVVTVLDPAAMHAGTMAPIAIGSLAALAGRVHRRGGPRRRPAARPRQPAPPDRAGHTARRRGCRSRRGDRRLARHHGALLRRTPTGPVRRGQRRRRGHLRSGGRRPRPARRSAQWGADRLPGAVPPPGDRPEPDAPGRAAGVGPPAPGLLGDAAGARRRPDAELRRGWIAPARGRLDRRAARRGGGLVPPGTRVGAGDTAGRIRPPPNGQTCWAGSARNVFWQPLAQK